MQASSGKRSLGIASSAVMTPPRQNFQVLVVDRQNGRREQVLEFLTELGFVGVQTASAPDSAASFADAHPPHVALLFLDLDQNDQLENLQAERAFREAEKTVVKLRAISRETQIILLLEKSKTPDAAYRLATKLVKKMEVSAPIWDIVILPELESGEDARLALEITMDRACRRLFFQFETEHWHAKFHALHEKVQSQNLVPARFQKNHFQEVVENSVRDFARARDFDSVIATATKTFSRIVDDRPVVYMRWLAVRSSFVIQHVEGMTNESLKGIGFAVLQPRSLKELSRLESLNSFVRDVFQNENSTALLHGSPDEPQGLFLLLGDSIDPAGKSEFEAVALLFDLSWGRIQALRDRHSLERIDRGTGLPNKMAMKESFEQECVRARRLRHPLAAAAIEIFHDPSLKSLKPLGDSLGPSHEAVMKIAGQTFRRALRGTDLVARVEKNRFVVLMPHTPLVEAMGIIDRLCRLIERLQLPALEQAGIKQLRARSGISEYPNLCRDADGLIESMENALSEVIERNSDSASSSRLVKELKSSTETGVSLPPPDTYSTRHVHVYEVPVGFIPDFEPLI